MSKFIPFCCSICQRLVQNEPDCAAYPVNDGRCCLRCDIVVVTSARLRLAGLNDEAIEKHIELSMAIYNKSREDPDWFLKASKGGLDEKSVAGSVAH